MSAKTAGGQAAKPAAAAPKAGKSLGEFRATYDRNFIVPQKIKAALAKLRGGWEYEVDFARLAGASLMDIGRVREQFADHLVVVGRDGRRAWAGTKATAEAMRKMLE